MSRGAEPGPDGALRCPWALSAPDYLGYHDDEWGAPLHGDDELFERMTLEAFQSGLSWLIILRKRPGFRTAFAGFSIADVAGFDERDVERLLADPGIVRNRLKIEAAIANARVAADPRRRPVRPALVLCAEQAPAGAADPRGGAQQPPPSRPRWPRS